MTAPQGSTAPLRRAFARSVDPAWRMTTGEDLRVPQTRGERSAATRFIHWYMPKVHTATAFSPLAAERFYAVMTMVAALHTLFSPRVVLEATTASRRPAALPTRAAASSLQ